MKITQKDKLRIENVLKERSCLGDIDCGQCFFNEYSPSNNEFSICDDWHDLDNITDEEVKKSLTILIYNGILTKEDAFLMMI